MFDQATVAYHAELKRVREAIAALEILVEAHACRANGGAHYGQVGDLQHLSVQLRDSISFMS
jgi:hypothetical protein